MHSNKLFSLDDKVAFVIGGAGKIGFAIAQGLGEAGAIVIIASRSIENYEKAVSRLNNSGLRAIGMQVDQANEGEVKKCLDEVSKSIKVPDILVNCGVERPMKNYFDDSTDAWDASMIANSRGLFVTCRAFANAMAKNGGGSIINVSSIYGIVAPDPLLYEGTSLGTEPDYPYNKGGMIMFSKYLAAKFAQKNVRVNVIAPGGFLNSQGEPFYSQYCKKVPLGRMATHDDMKGAAVFLSSMASSYITGAVLPIDGGFTMI
jgi:NAD(P)-dependent dehydrogenase (short-subunit alcohol dehydrogenase family)